jgi:hypothetical protein
VTPSSEDAAECGICGIAIYRTNIDGRWHHSRPQDGHAARPPDVAASEAAELSRLLFEAREQIAMWADFVSSRSGAQESAADRVRDRIDAYRTRRGWNLHGFGGET